MCFKHSPILLKDTPGACGRGHLFDECTAPVIRASASRRRRRVTPRAPRTYHPHMSNGDLHWIANYIWGIADDVLRDLYVRGKYRDVILPMTVLRRLDAVLVESKPNVLEMKAVLDQTGVVEQDAASGRRRDRPSTTPRSSPCATSGPALAGSSSGPTSRPTSTASRPTYRTFSRTSSSVTRSRGSRRPTPWVRSSRSSPRRTSTSAPPR